MPSVLMRNGTGFSYCFIANCQVALRFNTLWKFNPDMASDPLTSGSFVQRAVDYGAVTTDEVAKIVQTRKQMREAQSREGLISDSIGFGTGIGAGTLMGGPA